MSDRAELAVKISIFEGIVDKGKNRGGPRSSKRVQSDEIILFIERK